MKIFNWPNYPYRHWEFAKGIGLVKYGESSEPTGENILLKAAKIGTKVFGDTSIISQY